MQGKAKVARALIAVSDPKGLIEFIKGLHALDIQMISTGDTYRLLREANIPVLDVEEIVEFPGMIEGHARTLNPKIHGGISGHRHKHADMAKKHNIEWIDLVVVNLYPFAEAMKKQNAKWEDLIKKIDVGSSALIHAAAKNLEWVTVVVDPADYQKTLEELKNQREICLATRKSLAAKAFKHTAEHDALLHHYFRQGEQAHHVLPPLHLTLGDRLDLHSGENPHQRAYAYFNENMSGVLLAKQYQGKPLSYNHILDADAAVDCVRGFNRPTCVIAKHANPCGAATADTLAEAFLEAYQSDNLSAFGGVVALNQVCDKATAEKIADIFFEVVIAPDYTKDALKIFLGNSNLRVLALPDFNYQSLAHEYKFVEGGVLVQERDQNALIPEDLKIVTKTQPTEKEIDNLLFAWHVIKHVKSNAILIAKDCHTVGIGGGQVSRTDAIDMAVRKAGDKIAGSVLASDAFFPFRDSIDRIAHLGIRAIIQPGGSMRDEDVIAACDEHNIAMVFTGKCCFKH